MRKDNNLIRLVNGLADTMGRDARRVQRAVQYHEYLIRFLFAHCCCGQSMDHVRAVWDKRCQLADLCGCEPGDLETEAGLDKVRAFLGAAGIQLCPAAEVADD